MIYLVFLFKLNSLQLLLQLKRCGKCYLFKTYYLFCKTIKKTQYTKPQENRFTHYYMFYTKMF